MDFSRLDSPRLDYRHLDYFGLKGHLDYQGLQGHLDYHCLDYYDKCTNNFQTQSISSFF